MVNLPKPGQFLTSAQACPVCATPERRVVATHARDGSALTTVMCTGCGLVHSHPMPSAAELDAFYASQYRAAYKGTLTPKLKHALRYATSAIARVQRLRAVLPQGAAVLDVGAGSGEFLYSAAQAGFVASGLEPHEGYSRYVRERYNLPVTNATITTAHFAPASFDAITLNHVLEHLPDPVGALSQLNAWLKPEGVLFVEVPDIANDTHAPSRRYHYAHVYNYNAVTLQAVLTKSGFTVLPTKCRKPTSVLARKTGAPTPELILADRLNYEMLWDRIGKATDLQHHLGWNPYHRIMSKALRYPAEWLLTRRFKSSEDILKQAIEKAQLRSS